MKNKYTVRLPGFGLLVILLFALSFCGTPDLHDAIIQHVKECK